MRVCDKKRESVCVSGRGAGREREKEIGFIFAAELNFGVNILHLTLHERGLKKHLLPVPSHFFMCAPRERERER